VARKKEKMLRETAPKYKTTPDDSPGGALWSAFEALDEDGKHDFLARLLEDAEMREDLFDSILVIERRDEPTRPYEDFEAEMRKQGLL
jgi:hypothetical protein